VLSSQEELQPLPGSGALVELIPYLLGYHPSDSVVVVDMDPRRLVAGSVLLRMDLDRILADPEAVGDLGRPFVGSAGVVVVIYGPAARSTALLFPELSLSLGALGVWMVDAILVDGGLWWSLRFGDPCCRPENGTPVQPPADRPTPVTALATYAGWTALPDREALARTLDRVPAADDAELAAAIVTAEAEMVAAAASPAGLSRWRRATTELFRAVLRQARAGVDRYPPFRIATADVARLLSGLADRVVRDRCWRALECDTSSTAFNVCWDLVRRAPDPYRAPPLFLLGWVAWRRGNPSLADLAAERGLVADAGYEAARLLRVIVDRGVPPTRVTRLPRRIRRRRR
jgi:Domain of unknown function (DUF4192)